MLALGCAQLLPTGNPLGWLGAVASCHTLSRSNPDRPLADGVWGSRHARWRSWGITIGPNRCRADPDDRLRRARGRRVRAAPGGRG